MVRQSTLSLIARVAFAAAMLTQAQAATLEYDCGDKSGPFYNIWVDLDRSTVSMHNVHPDMPQELRTYQAEITPTTIRWVVTGQQVSVNISIDRATGRYFQVYGGVARGTNTFQCKQGQRPLP